MIMEEPVTSMGYFRQSGRDVSCDRGGTPTLTALRPEDRARRGWREYQAPHFQFVVYISPA
jgi:hypothetical protein